MSDRLEGAPEHCPGTESDNAGKAAACAGCPNQNICSSGLANQPDPAIAQVQERLSNVKHKILVISGKGGVGKSTLTALLGRTLAALNPDMNIGILDIDICGPSQPRVMGVLGEQVHNSGSGWSPVYIDDNLSLMSIGFLLGSPDDAIIWRGPKKNGMIKQFLSEVDWGNLEYLLIDTPPGTSDEHLSAVNYLAKAGLTGAVVVTTPQEVALLDVRKEIDFCNKLKLPILGVIENMSLFVCPSCKVCGVGLSTSELTSDLPLSKIIKMHSEIFPATTGGATQLCADTCTKLIGKLPLDPTLARYCDEGKNFIEDLPESPAVKEIKNIVQKLVERCHATE